MNHSADGSAQPSPGLSGPGPVDLETSPRGALGRGSGEVGVRGLRFGPFELDLQSGELWRAGIKVRIQRQPFKVLTLLASRSGELLTREQLQKSAWDDGIHVDFEQSLNFCIRQVRSALGDHADAPHYVETLPRQGYRFLVPVDLVSGGEPGLSRSTPEPGGGPAIQRQPAPAAARSGRSVLPGLALAILAMLSWVGATRTRPAAPPQFERVTFRRGSVTSARFGTDGRVVYAAAWEGRTTGLYVAGGADEAPRPLAQPSPWIVVAGVSPRGDVAFRYPDGVLARTSLIGGPVKEMLKGIRSADWSSDQRFAVARESSGGYQIEYPAGTPLGHAEHPSHLRISPTGDHLAFLEHPSPNDDRGSVVVLDRSGRRVAGSSGWASLSGLAWAPDSREVWFTGSRTGADTALHALALNGTPRLVFPALGRLVLHDVAPDGQALLSKDVERKEIFYRRPGEDGERNLSWLDMSSPVQLSADGRRVLFFEGGQGGGHGYSVFVRDVAEEMPVRLGSGWAQSLSPDGQRVLATPAGAADRIDVLPVGPGEKQVIQDPGFTRYGWARWLPDGRSLVFLAQEGGRSWRVYRRDLDRATARAVTPPDASVNGDALAPDGSRIIVRLGGSYGIYPLDGGEPEPIPGLDDRYAPIGWAGPQTLNVRETGQANAKIHQLDLPSGRLTLWKVLAPRDRSGLTGVIEVLTARDSGAYVYAARRRLSELYVVKGLGRSLHDG